MNLCIKTMYAFLSISIQCIYIYIYTYMCVCVCVWVCVCVCVCVLWSVWCNRAYQHTYIYIYIYIMNNYGITPAIATANKTAQVVRQLRLCSSERSPGPVAFYAGRFFVARCHAVFAVDRRHACIHLYNYDCEYLYISFWNTPTYYIYIYIYIHMFMYVYECVKTPQGRCVRVGPIVDIKIMKNALGVHLQPRAFVCL